VTQLAGFRRDQLAARLLLVRRLGLRHLHHRQRLRSNSRKLAGRTALAAETMWRDAAAALGARVTRLTPTILEFELDGTVARIAHVQTTPLNDPVAHHLATDKPTVGRLLEQADLPVAGRALLEGRDVDGAMSFLATGSLPVIVKPARGSGGVGVDAHNRTPAQLRQALHDTRRYGGPVLLERQRVAPTYRLLFLDGELLDVIRRPLPSVVGDGESSIAELVTHEAERRLDAGGASAGEPHLEIDLDCLFTLAGAQRTPWSTPAAGERVVVKSATNFCAAAEVETVVGLLHPSIVDDAARAAAVVGLRLAGVDVVTGEPGSPLRADGGFVLEVNPVPGLSQHLRVGNRSETRQVAERVLAALLDR
jgi:cyanophycin synthetase